MPGKLHDWLAHARSDLSLAKLAQGNEDIIPEQVCFHTQQAAEKALKAVLVARKVAFPYAHDLNVLFRVALDAGIEVPEEVLEAESLTPYAVEARYLGYWEEITPSEVGDALELAATVVSWAAELIDQPDA